VSKPARMRPLADDCSLTGIFSNAGITKSSVIRVTGPAGLPALLWFCRHGFEKVGYVRAGSRASDDGDLLLITQTCGIELLDTILATGSHPRPGGILIAQTPDWAAGAASDPVHALLATRGYDVERCLHGRRKELHVARRRSRVLQRAA
jgi:hypothetical protein